MLQRPKETARSRRKPGSTLRGVFFQDGFDALRHVVLDRLDDVDRPAQNQVAGFFVAA